MDSIEEAIRKAMKEYYKGRVPEASYKASGGRPKFTYKYFSSIEREYFGKATDWECIKKGDYNDTPSSPPKDSKSKTKKDKKY